MSVELARALGLDDKQREQLELSLLQELEKAREEIFRSDENKDNKDGADEGKKKGKGHGPRPQRQLPLLKLPAFELSEEDRGCKVCGGTVEEMKGASAIDCCYAATGI